MTREEKIERYFDAVVQDMDWKTLYLYCYWNVCDAMKHDTDEEIDELYSEYFEDNDE
tara:strand:- start:787 stop:957 length:171 start_codon:yes stop_codon:yes gene_type:complete